MTEARQTIDRTMELDPRFRSAVQTSGWCYVAAGDLDAAAAEFERLPGMAGRVYASASDRAYVYAKLGRTADVERMLVLLDTRRDAQPDVTLDLDYALVYEGLGDRARALEYLSSAIDRRMGSVVLLETFISFQDARRDPRFGDLMRRIGLPQAATALHPAQPSVP